ncbi:MAG: YncE family protein [bacterium]|nr:YncE family protein [bacterium]
MKNFVVILSAVIALALLSCRNEDIIFIPEEVPTTQPEYTEVEGFYLLCEGNMGSNKASLDWFDAATGKYYRNIYAYANPYEVKELGDVGNDVAIYGSKLWVVVNCSNKVMVLDKHSAKIQGQVDIPNCRYIKFHQGYAYVTSYAGPVELDPDYKQLGYVAKIDTATLQEVGRCTVGFQPDQLEIVNGKIYVANSGGYMFPNYENTLSVIDIATFKEERRIPIAINLGLCKADRHGVLWVASRGDYYETEARLFAYDTRKDRLVATLDVPVSNFWLDGDSLYIVSAQWSNISMDNAVTYAIVDVNKMAVVSRQIITDGTDQQIEVPYGIAVHPITKDIYVTDAKKYWDPGHLYCFDKEGKLKWDVRTGDIPGHFAFLGKNLNEQ